MECRLAVLCHTPARHSPASVLLPLFQSTCDLPMYRHLRGVSCGNGGGSYDEATRGLGGNPGQCVPDCCCCWCWAAHGCRDSVGDSVLLRPTCSFHACCHATCDWLCQAVHTACPPSRRLPHYQLRRRKPADAAGRSLPARKCAGARVWVSKRDRAVVACGYTRPGGHVLQRCHACTARAARELEWQGTACQQLAATGRLSVQQTSLSVSNRCYSCRRCFCRHAVMDLGLPPSLRVRHRCWALSRVRWTGVLRCFWLHVCWLLACRVLVDGTCQVSMPAAGSL